MGEATGADADAALCGGEAAGLHWPLPSTGEQVERGGVWRLVWRERVVRPRRAGEQPALHSLEGPSTALGGMREWGIEDEDRGRRGGT